MKSPESRHYTGEELLLHALDEGNPGQEAEIEVHLDKCTECRAVAQEYQQLLVDIRGWNVEEMSEATWELRKNQLLEQFRADPEWLRKERFGQSFLKSFHLVWNYALENPLSTMGYIAVAFAFAFERTITVFRLDRILPGTNEVFEILKQVL